MEKEDEKQESEGDIDQEQSSEKDQVLVTRSKDTGGIRTRRRGQGGRSLPRHSVLNQGFSYRV